MLQIFYNTAIFRNIHDFIIANARAKDITEDNRKGVTVESLIDLAESNIKDAVYAFYDQAYQKALVDNPEGGEVEADRAAITALNEEIHTYLSDILGGGDFLTDLDELVAAIYASNGFSRWKEIIKQRFHPFTNTVIPTKVKVNDSTVPINISEEQAEITMNEETLSDILESLNAI